jgi:phosphatidate cytidylyltransferase
MSALNDPSLVRLLEIIFGLLGVATLIGFVLSRTIKSDSGRATVRNLNARTAAWWVMAGLVVAAALAGFGASVALFAVISFFALREFITLTPTHRGDHRALFWIFFVFTPLQYWLIWTDWYGLFTILIPVYAFLFVPIRAALAGDTTQFLERTAKIQWGLMVCVYCVSHAPALLTLKIPGFEGQNVKLLLFLLIVVQLSDVFQYVWGKLVGRHKLAPHVSPNKTWEGLIGGGFTASALGTALYWTTPFTPVQAGLISLLIVLMGFAGGLVMSAIKRDRGVKDYGTVIVGHGGVMDRIDSICFAAPVFFHVVRQFWTP